MYKEERIPKLVILQSELDKNFMRDNLKSCYDCNSNLTYVEEVYGIVCEKDEFMVMGNKSKFTYRLRVVHINLYCAECGKFVDDYFKTDSNDTIVHYFDYDLNGDEKIEIEYCLDQFNQSGDFTPRWNIPILNTVKSKLKEYDSKIKN